MVAPPSLGLMSHELWEVLLTSTVQAKQRTKQVVVVEAHEAASSSSSSSPWGLSSVRF